MYQRLTKHIEKAVKQVRPRLSGGQNYNPLDHGTQFVAQRTSCHQQDDSSRPALLVAKDGRSIPCNVSGKSGKPNIPSTEKTYHQ